MEGNFLQNENNIAITEVSYIIDHFCSPYAKTKIPDKFKSFLKENSIPNYTPEFKDQKELKDIKLKSKTESLLALVYRDYLCTDDEKERLIEKNNIKLLELEEKYDITKIFQNRKNILVVHYYSNSFISYINISIVGIKNKMMPFFLS